MHRAWFALALALLPLLAMPDVVSSAPDAVSVTIYRDPNAAIGVVRGMDNESGGLAMVTETRVVDVPAGVSRLIFLGVADAIVPQTASIDGLPAIVLESNFDYDLLTPGAIIAKSHGETVRFVRTDATTGAVTERDAVIRTGPEGVMLEVDGKMEALGCSGLAEKLIFPRLPSGLASEPKLSMTVRAQSAGRHTIQLSYLALGLDWSADYVARIDPNRSTLNLTGWITLVNRASTTFANVPAEVVAGDLARDEQETQPPRATFIQQQDACWPTGSFLTRRSVAAPAASFAPQFMMMDDRDLSEVVVTGVRNSVALEAKMSELGDYKLYTLPEPTTIAARQSKQVRFLGQANIPFKRLYAFKLDTEQLSDSSTAMAEPTMATLRLINKKSEGLGKPLPAGVISVMEGFGGKADSPLLLAGQDTLKDTPVGLPFEIELGRAIDVWVEARVTEEETVEEQPGVFAEQVAIEVRVGNDKPVAVLVEYRPPGARQDFRVMRESRAHTLKDGDPLWTFKLPPGARAVLTYVVRKID